MPRSMFRPSVVLEGVHFNDKTKVLTATFTNGAEYEYYSVPERVFNRLNAAESKGRYFNANIRNKYAFTRTVAPVNATAPAQVQPVAVPVP